MICCAVALRSSKGFSWMNMRAAVFEELPPVAPTNPDHRLHAGIGQDDLRELVLDLGHGGERHVLARLGLAEDEAGVLLGKEALRDDDIERSR